METRKLMFQWCRVPIGMAAFPRLRNGSGIMPFVLSLLLTLLSVTPASASEFWINIKKNKITVSEPWLIYEVMVHDWNGKDSYFPNQYPYLYVDGVVVGHDQHLQWAMHSYGDGDHPSSWNNTDSYFCKWRNDDLGVTVQAFDPHETGGRAYVSFYVYFDKVEVGKTHSFSIGANWVCDRGSSHWRKVDVTTEATEDPFPALGTLKRKSDCNVNYAGNLNQRTNYTNYFGFYKGSVTKPQEDTNAFLYTAVDQSISQTSLDIPVGSNVDTKDIYPQMLLSRSTITIGNVTYSPTFYKNFPKQTLVGFASPTDLTLSTELWEKKVILKWGVNETDKDKAGTWTIYRRKNGDPADSRTVVTSGLAYGTRQFTDTDVPYDTEYLYEVVFVPNNFNSTVVAADLTASKTATLERNFTFSSLTASETFEDKIVFSWKHSPYQNAASHNYTLIVQRSTSDPTLPAEQMVWQDVKTYNIGSKTTTSGSYEDVQDLESFQDYSYRLKTTVFDKDYVSEKVTGHLAGMSYVTDFSATRGTYSSMVKLKWTVKQVGNSLTYYDVQRRPLGSGDEDNWITLATVSGVASSYSYDDVTALPGSYNQYRITTWTMYHDERKGNSTTLTDGFSVATGVISGRITYGNGTAVEGVKVTLIQNSSDGEVMNAMRSLKFTGAKSGMIYNTTGKDVKKLFGKDFSVQLFVNPSLNEMGEDGTTYNLVHVDDLFDITLTYDAANEQYLLGAIVNGESETSTLAIPRGEWRHLTCVHNATAGTTTFYVTKNGESQQTEVLAGRNITSDGDNKTAAKVSLAYLDDAEEPTFKGYVDEFRVFTKALSEKDILKNYNHPLSGSETSLAIYWPMDEGIEGQEIAYDFSKTNNVGNGRHGVTEQAAISDMNVPGDKELSLMAYTNEQGTYEVRGIPFSGEGTSYTITPTMGTHEFKAAYLSRFINMSMLNHSGVDFEDVSSFKVSGVAYYDHTTIPVEGAYLYIDGTMASKDGDAIMTDSNGEFTVDVPIGDHFIQIKKQGHTFKYDGRYPDDPNGAGLRETFESEKANLTFFDQTTVKVAGRVAGGDIEFEKPLGLGQGVANIGKAQLRLSLSNENGYLNVDDQDPNSTTFTYNQSTEQRDFKTETGLAYVPGSKNFITIETDAETGEWVALLPPLRYDVTEVVITNNAAITKENFSLPVIDATNPNMVYTDSVETENGYRKFEYQASAKMEYKAQSTIEVTEHEDGSFGMDSYDVKDVNGKKHTVALYQMDEDGNAILDANGKVQYTFGVSDKNPNGYPVYRELDYHTYHLYAYECYTNYDGTKPVVYEVPLAGKEVTIKNQFAATTAVAKEDGSLGDIVNDKLELNDNGQADYVFRVGFPNIQEPYTRGLSISYDNNGTEMSWNGNGTFQVIVLGGLPTGNNFVTQGPDEVLMVLRDPPGTNSSTTWSKGKSVKSFSSYTNEFHSDFNLTATVYTGVETATGTGATGFMVIMDQQSTANLDIGAQYADQRTGADSHEGVLTTTRDISTSDAMDFVGPCGDVFIGSAKNIIFGACRAVDVYWNDATNQPELRQEDALATGEEFTTGFAYTQNYIQGVLIPNFETLRNSLLTPVADVSSVQRPAKGEDPIYVTTLDKNDPKYGTSNSDEDVWDAQAVPFSKLKDGIYKGPSYTMLLPVDYEKDKDGLQDMVQFYNAQIKRWERELYNNEKAKVTAIQNREKWFRENHSLDAGSTITVTCTKDTTDTYTTTHVDEINAVLGLETGYRFSGLGVGFKAEETIGHTFTDEWGDEYSETETTSYTLQEDGDDDYLSVDVFNAPDGFAPIFVTRGGATSGPYEDEVVTEYYKPGTVIMHKTVQIEKPEIEAQTQLITGVPAGGTGTFKVNIRNNSETGEDCWFDLLVTPESNPDGLSVSMDDTSLNYGTSVLVKSGETMVKTISVRQTNPDVLNYENVKIRIASQTQKDNTSTYHEIADTTEFSVYFQPTCSDINLASTHTLVNSDTETPVTLSMSGYNYSMASLKGIRLEYKAVNDADFRTLQEYTKDEDRLQSDPNLKELIPLEGTNKLTYLIDLRTNDFADKTYVFRAVTVCDQGGVEVNNESMEIEIVRDMTRPTLIATPSPASGILTSADDLLLTFNEDIQGSILTKPNNFDVVGELNEGEVAHDVALSLTGENPAKTEATMSLSGKSFTTNMWVNYSTDGTLLTHGSADCNFTIAIEQGKLAVSVAGEKTVSTETLPKDKWIYLNVAYEAPVADGSTTATLNAAYAKDAETVTLINSVATKAYEGNGPVSVGGNGLTAKVQELALWNQNRSMAEALAEMYTTKSPHTSGLIGYWQLNEGRGEVASDKARARHFTLPSQNAWWIEGKNYALTLDGTKAAAVNIGSLNTTGAEDYMIETWFKADKTQNGVASVMGTQKMDLRLNEQGQMELMLGSTANTDPNNLEHVGNIVHVSNKDLRDGQWHHVAVSVLKSANGSGIVYIDGEQAKLVSASAMPVLYGDKLMLGGRRVETVGTDYNFTQMLKGAIDEVRIWKGRRTTDVIKNYMYTRVKADEAGLVAYYPLEKNGLDAYNQIVTTSTFTNSVDGSTPWDMMFFDAEASELSPLTSDLSSINTPALKQAPRLENVQFNFVASERQIKVNLEELPARMEGCHIYITAKNVKDMNGNSAQPITWCVYVQQNSLRWQDTEIAVTKSGAEPATFTTAIENVGSENEAWTLSGMPSWLTANVENGSLMPLTTGSLTFTVSEALPIGTYETTVYLIGSKNIGAPLNITVTSEGQVPDWSVNPRDFENSMNVIGRVELLGVPMNDEADILGAFVGEECRGVAHLEYKERYDGYFVTMDIYGNETNTPAVEFRFYDASTGTIYPAVVPNPTIKFEPLVLTGKYDDPVVFDVLDKVEQNIDLKEGWNWISLNVQAESMKVPDLFKNLDDDVYIIKSQTEWTMYDSESGKWGGSMTGALTNDKMYAVKMLADSNLRIVGQRVSPKDCPIALNDGWNWIGYYGRQVASVTDAMSGMNPENGDILKGQIGVTYFDSDEWAGSIHMMEPGKGYMVKIAVGSARTFGYPTATVVGAPRRHSADDNQTTAAQRSAAFTPVDFRLYSGNAIMAAKVVVAGKAVANAEIGVFADGECRASGVTNENGVAYLTIPGDDAATLTFKVAMGDQEADAAETLDYEADAAYGSPARPFVIDLDNATGIETVQADSENQDVYDLQGRKITQKMSRLSKGIYIVNGKKQFVK